MLIDTPGMRELGVQADEETLGKAFEDVEELVHECRFRDCRHASEPGCAGKAALKEGTLETERLNSYLKLQRAAKLQAHRQARKARIAEKKTRRRAGARTQCKRTRH